jgi:hypothetical protein
LRESDYIRRERPVRHRPRSGGGAVRPAIRSILLAMMKSFSIILEIILVKALDLLGAERYSRN